MSLFNTFRKRLTNQFVAVIVEEDQCKIRQKIIKNGNILFVEESTFDIVSKDKLSDEVIDYLNDLQDEYEHTYIILFLNTNGQGLLPRGCDYAQYKKFGIDQKNVKSVCIENRYIIYASKIDVKWADKTFASIGLDFVFSPFLLLDSFSVDDRDENVKLFILNSRNSFTMMIMKENHLLFGSFFNIAKEDDLLNLNYDEFSDQSNEALEDNNFDMDNLDDELEIAEINDIDEMSVGKQNTHVHVMSDKDERFIKYLDVALKEFYSNDQYDSEFVDSVHIYDDAGMSEGVINYIQNELLLDTVATNINIREKLIKLAKKEVLSE
jgi:hypothetical protein